MLDTLLEMLRDDTVTNLIRDPNTAWQSLKVRYETPHVDRAWVQVGENRLNLHRIYPCEKPLLHPHPWPSAVYIVKGRYEMAVGYASPSYQRPPPVAAKMILNVGSSYEMVHPSGWHSVRPQIECSLSVMLTGKPWGDAKVKHPGKGLVHEPLSPEELARLLSEFDRGW